MLREFCTSNDDLDRFFTDVFDRLDILASELAGRQQAWLVSRHQSETELDRRAAQLDDERAQLVADRERFISELRENGQRATAAMTQNQEQLSQLLDRLEAGDWRSQLHSAAPDSSLPSPDSVEAQAEKLAMLTEELAVARNELAEARREITSCGDQLKSAIASSGQSNRDRQLEDQICRLQEECDQLRQQRLLLEAELDSVRSRAAETAEALAQQQRQQTDERAAWADELKRMREATEAILRQCNAHDRLETRERTSEARGSCLPPQVSPFQPPSDPVLGSVMAQFEMLQEDIHRRRREQRTES